MEIHCSLWEVFFSRYDFAAEGKWILERLRSAMVRAPSGYSPQAPHAS